MMQVQETRMTTMTTVTPKYTNGQQQNWISATADQIDTYQKAHKLKMSFKIKNKIDPSMPRAHEQVKLSFRQYLL